MKNSRWFVFCAAVLGGAALVGCGKAAPDGFPETQPFTVKVVDGGKGIEGVQVTLAHADPKGVGAVAGTTNSSGVAKMTTTFKNFTADGAPAGEYRVQCVKDPVVDHWKTDAEMSAMSPGERTAYFEEWKAKCDEQPREVPKALGNYDATPLTATVAAGGGELVVDVAEYAE